MRDDRTHPLLAQVPLTVSPFVTLPTPATLPYTFRPMPSCIPPSSTGVGTTPATTSTDPNNPSASAEQQQQQQQQQQLPAYVISPSGHAAAHPTSILSSCGNLLAHVEKLRADADREVRELDRRIREAELAEKRRVAPGWLDSEARLLEPEKHAGGDSGGSSGEAGAMTMTMMTQAPGVVRGGGDAVMSGQFAQMSLADREGASEMAVDQLDEGTQIDRAFGGK